MIKRIIFDIDNTLIDWKDEYNNVVGDVLKKLDIQCSNNTVKMIKECFNTYELENYTFNKEKMSDFIPYKKLSKVYYNKVFAMYFFLTNTSALEAYSIKVHTKENQSEDIFHYQFVDRDILEPAVFSKNTMIDSAEGVVLECLMKPIIYKKNIKLPVFVIEIWNNKNNLIYTWQNDPLYLKCVWVGQTKLIGSNYEKIINTICYYFSYIIFAC